MNISYKSIVSDSDMIKNYKSCRNKAERMGRITIMKDNEPDAVLLSVNEYEQISAFIEYVEDHEDR